jgi:hypothetical protein
VGGPNTLGSPLSTTPQNVLLLDGIVISTLDSTSLSLLTIDLVLFNNELSTGFLKFFLENTIIMYWQEYLRGIPRKDKYLKKNP